MTATDMPPAPAAAPDKLVVAISSRALFDFEEENQLFDSGQAADYMQLQLERLEVPARPSTSNHGVGRPQLQLPAGWRTAKSPMTTLCAGTEVM